MSQDQATKKRLVYAILKFLGGEIQAESSNAERRESIEGIFIDIINFYFNNSIFFSCCSMS